MRDICVIGTGYVGLVTGTCFADLGNRVFCLDINEDRINKLRRNIMPIYEPGLEEIVERNVKSQRLIFTTDYEEALKNAEFAFIAVGTPSGVDGEADLQYVKDVVEKIADIVDHPLIVVNKSTVPVGTGDWVADIITKKRGERTLEFAVVSNPEFLREGSAIGDFMNPDRVVLGSLDHSAAEKVAELYSPLRAPVLISDIRTAEMIKYASNAFLATRISFINEIANICDELGADVREVADGMGLDKRIGRSFLDAGLGWGGSCFPKDVKALAHMAVLHNTQPQLLQAVMDINRNQRRRVVYKLRKVLGGSFLDKTIGILGLSFKPNTDDMREAPAVEI
ncbi:MAG: UDP-glucose/GDP-mannose dehydrogenase family protein, partial [Chloroflexi bacterium]|nr:UDP-glucose/GDP-mannose dehydrogenase family protein [Chloroflexota bacterium]